MPDVLTIEIEKPEGRVRYDRLASVVSGQHWDMLQGGGVGIDDVTKTGILLPRVYESSWFTSSASPYNRLTKAEYLLTTPSKWVDYQYKFNGDNYLHSLDVNEKVYTGATYPQNQGFFLSWVAYNAGNDVFVAMECGWAEGAADGDVRLRFYSDGSTEVYRNSELINASASIVTKENYPSQFGAQGQTQGAGKQQMANRTVDVVLLPARLNELLVVSPTEGGGFNTQFPLIDTNVANPKITGAGRFWWYVPTGQATVQCAPLKFNTLGTLIGPSTRFRYPPKTGSVGTARILYDFPGYGSTSVGGTIMKDDLSGTFLPDGTVDTYRIKAVLYGDGSATPFVYGGIASYPGSAENTGGTALNISAYVAGEPAPSLYVGDRSGDTRLSFEIFSPDELGSIPSAANIGAIPNRPIRAMIGTVPFLTGRTEIPDYVASSGGDRADRLIMEARDYWKVFENYRIVDPEPLDGMNLGSAVAYLVGLAGFGTSQYEIEPVDITLGTVSAASKGEFVVYPDVTQSVADWLHRLHDDYAATFTMCWTPKATGPVFRFVGTATLGTTPAGTLYSSHLGTSDPNLWYRSFREDSIEPEANEIYIVGRDPRTSQAIITHYVDEDSADPTTAPEDRPFNWLGERRRYALIEPAITSIELANYCAGILRERLTYSRFVAEWRSTFLLKGDGSPYWIGDVVQLDGHGPYRINSLSCSFPAEGSLLFRDAQYTGEYIGA